MTKFIWPNIEKMSSGSYPLFHKIWQIFFLLYSFLLHVCQFQFPNQFTCFLRARKSFTELIDFQNKFYYFNKYCKMRNYINLHLLDWNKHLPAYYISLSTSCISHINIVKQIVFLCPFYRQGNRGQEKLKDLLMSIHVVQGRAGLEPKSSYLNQTLQKSFGFLLLLTWYQQSRHRTGNK